MVAEKSRKPLAVVLLTGVLLVGVLIATLGWDRAWQLWGVPVAVQRFFDSQVIAAGASSWRDGYDPLRFNPHDIGRRPMNYPRVWQSLFVVGLRQEHAEALGWTFAAMLAAGIWLALPPLGLSEAAGVGLALFSPAVLLGVERGNTDLAVFFVLACAVAVPRAAWNAAWIATAFALKLFPLAGVAVLLGRGRREALFGLGAVAVFAALYVWLNFDDLVFISASTPRDTWFSFGMNVLPLRLARISSRLGGLAQVAAWVAVGAIAFAALRARLAHADGEEPATDRALDAFRVGAACYIGVFLIGNNFAYRLVFVVLTLPELMRWARAPGLNRRAALLGTAAAYLSLWTLALDRGSWAAQREGWLWFGAGQIANWVLFAALFRSLVSTMPDWTIVPLRRLGGARKPAAAG